MDNVQVYHGKRLDKPIVMKQGKARGYRYFIITLGSHPCSYILFPKGHKWHGEHYDNIPLDCHGGLTYARDTFLDGIDLDGAWVVGWDYAHLGDFASYGGQGLGFKGHKWTIDELQTEMDEVLDQLDPWSEGL